MNPSTECFGGFGGILKVAPGLGSVEDMGNRQHPTTKWWGTSRLVTPFPSGNYPRKAQPFHETPYCKGTLRKSAV
jgi:hypothetical protein